MSYCDQCAKLQYECDSRRKLCDELSSENFQLRSRVTELERSSVKLNEDKMAFMREFVLKSCSGLGVERAREADAAWNAIVAACEVKP